MTIPTDAEEFAGDVFPLLIARWLHLNVDRPTQERLLDRLEHVLAHADEY